ncbi:hypothetical protein AAG906_020838 [Vitis piasezkii]
MPLSQALRKLTKAKLLMALIPKSLPQLVPLQFKMDLYWFGSLGLAECNHKPIIGSHYTHGSPSD